MYDRTSPPHITTLVFATATSALSMNIFLPSLPAMARHFDTDYGVMQLAVSLYLVATALLQLVIGPLSDRYGRRPVMLSCFAVFLAGTLGAVFAPNVGLLLACRLLQGFSAAGMVLARAVVRDTVGADEAASRIGYITMGMALVPMVGPMIGGLLDEAFGWQSTFWLTLGFGAVATAIIWLDLGETNWRRSPSFVAQFKAYPELLASRRFWGYSLTAAFTSGAFFAFLGGGPFVSTEILGMSPSEYGFYFALISIGYMLGNFLSGRFSGRFGINRMMLAGTVIAVVGMSFSLVMFAAGIHQPISLFGPAFFTGMGNGMVLPNANAGMVSVRPHLAGSASGLGGALQIGGGAIMAVLAGAWLTVESGPYPLLWVMVISSFAATVATLYVIRVDRIDGPIG